MPAKTSKQAIQAITPPELPSAAPDIDIESAIADELLASVDWSKVRSALISKAKAKFIEMLFGNPSDRPINISPYPELAALPSADDEVAA